MKQYITIDQLNELSEKGKERLRKWWKPKTGNYYVIDRLHEERLLTPEYCPFEYDIKKEDYLKKMNRGAKVYPLTSIGQMIEFLSDYLIEDMAVTLHGGSFHLDHGAIDRDFGATFDEPMELCDALWDAMKAVLELKRY